MPVFTYNARLFINTPTIDGQHVKIVEEERLGLAPEQVCEFAKELHARNDPRRADLLIEVLCDGENYDAVVKRFDPDSHASGFNFRNILAVDMEMIECFTEDFIAFDRNHYPQF